MVAHAVVLVESLGSSDRSTRMRSLRCIKNAIIGNKSKKAAFLKAGALPRVLELLTNERDSDVLIQSATTLGSLTYGTRTGLEHLLQAAGLPGLVSTLSSEDPKVVEAAIRALKLVYLQPCDALPHEPVLQPGTLPRVVALLRDTSRPDVAEAAAVVLASCCASPNEQVAALGLLMRLLPGNHRAAEAALASPATLDTLLSLLRDQVPATRFAAAACLTHLAAVASALGTGEKGQLRCSSFAAAPTRVGAAPAVVGTTAAVSGRASPSGTSASGLAVTEQLPTGPLELPPTVRAPGLIDIWAIPGMPADAAAGVRERLAAAQHTVLPVLLRLLVEPDTLEQVPPVLAILLEGSKELQKAALDADVVRHLAALLASPTQRAGATAAGDHAAGPSGAAAGTPSAAGSGGGGDAADPTCTSRGAALQQGVLRALGNLCLTRDDGRKQLIEAKVLKHIVRSLEHPCDGVRAAAAVCVMALSRSIPTLRSSLLEAEVAQVLCRLLSDSCVDVQINAAATLCNLVLEFSSVKEAVLEHGALVTLTELTGSMISALRLHGCWALRNLAYKSSGDVRRMLMKGLPWSTMRTLLNDSDVEVQEQAVCLLRNLCMDSHAHIGAVLEWAGADLLACLEEKLDPSRIVPEHILLHALYTVSNVLTGSDAHKDAVMASNLPALLAHHLRCPASPDLRVSAIWCIINLTWPEANPGPATASRLRKLHELGVEDTLRGLVDDRNMNVKERAKTALIQFSSSSLATSGGIPAANNTTAQAL